MAVKPIARRLIKSSTVRQEIQWPAAALIFHKEMEMPLDQWYSKFREVKMGYGNLEAEVLFAGQKLVVRFNLKREDLFDQDVITVELEC